jgi:hypothetical protein
MSTFMKAHFRALLATSLLLLGSPALRAQEAPATEKKAIQMAGKHEISFNLRNLSFNEVNNSILGLAYRYHWNAKWNLRVQADVALNSFLSVEKVEWDTIFVSGVKNAVTRIGTRPNVVNFGAQIGVERKILVERGQLILGASLGYGFFRENSVRIDPTIATLTNTSVFQVSSIRLRPSVAYRYQFTKRLSATIESSISIDYLNEFTQPRFGSIFPDPNTRGSVNSSYLQVYSLPISALTLNLHL